MSQDPKYVFPGGVVHATGGYTIPDDEPLMVFRGKDVFTLAAIAGYLGALHEVEQTDTVREHVATAMERFQTIREWQQAHPERTGACCTTEAPIARMTNGQA